MTRNAKTIFSAIVCCVILSLSSYADLFASQADMVSDLIAQLPVPITAPNKFGLTGDDAWLEAGQRKVAFAPRKRVIEIDAPSVLDQPDTEYRLTKDVVADGTAFKIVKSNVTLNLNGHTVTYARKPTGEEGYGVHFTGQWQTFDVAVVNGTIIQAEPYAAGALGVKWGIPYGSGFSPVYGQSITNGEFAGLRLVYGGTDLSGIYVGGVGLHIHHNTIHDKGSIVVNRHRGLGAIEGGGKGTRIHHNVIVRARHNGIRSSGMGDVSNNIVTVDSCGTNSAGIAASMSVKNNKIIATGEHPVGFYIGGKPETGRIEYTGNYVVTQNTRNGEEYDNPGAVPMRLQWGDKIYVADNTFILRVDKSVNPKSWGRAFMVGLPEAGLAALFENNLILALSPDGNGKAAGISVVANNQSPHLVFRRNTVVSSWGCILLADGYGRADGFARFEENTFIKAVKSPEFKTIRSQLSDGPSTAVFSGNRFTSGASPDDVDLEFFGSALKEVAFTQKATIKASYADGKPAARAKVSITGKGGRELFSGETDEKGSLTADVASYLLSNRDRSDVERLAGRVVNAQHWRVDLSPHQVNAVGEGGKSAMATVSLSADTTVPLVLK